MSGNKRFIISGGGTGGHIFPALSIAGELRRRIPECEILFVGAQGRMEMERVPAAGYEIKGLPVMGFDRRNPLRNFKVVFHLVQSLLKAREIVSEFKPDVAIGVGGYASGPTLKAAQRMGVPTVLQEQNSYAGVTNKQLGSAARRICVAYEGMEKFFPKEKLVMSGNPIREVLSHPATEEQKAQALSYFGLTPGRKHLLIVGGSLGSGTLNRAVQHWIQDGCPEGEEVELIWQCGKYYKKDIDAFMEAHPGLKGIRHYDFIGRMDLAYAAADVVVSRSGASTVSELCAMGKATVFVPSPNVAEDHQTHNAMALVRKEAAMLVKDNEAIDELLPTAIALLNSPERREKLRNNARAMALTDAAQVICDEIYKLV